MIRFYGALRYAGHLRLCNMALIHQGSFSRPILPPCTWKGKACALPFQCSDVHERACVLRLKQHFFISHTVQICLRNGDIFVSQQPGQGVNVQACL